MPSRTRKTKSASTAATPATSAPPAPPSGSSAAASPPTSSAPTSTPLIFLDMPPPDANIPTPSSTFVPGDSADYRAVLPREAELRALPGAVKDIANFTNYTQVLGQTAPPYAQVQQSLILANAWSSMRTETAAWDAFCGSQEGVAWTMLRAQMERLQSSFELASTGPSNVSTLFPSLAPLLGAKKVIARKGASTRKLNKEATAKGQAPVHGRVGKARQRKAEKAAYAASAGGTSGGNGASAAAPVAGVTTPVAAPGTAAGTTSAVAPAASVVSPGTTNGASGANGVSGTGH